MIKISTSKISRNGNYDKQEVMDIIHKGLEAGETEFSTSLMGYGNSNLWQVLKEDYNQDYDGLRDLDIRETALNNILDEFCGKYTPYHISEYVVYILSHIVIFKVSTEAHS